MIIEACPAVFKLLDTYIHPSYIFLPKGRTFINQESMKSAEFLQIPPSKVQVPYEIVQITQNDDKKSLKLKIHET